MTCWKKLIPRLIFVALLPLALCVFANPLLRCFLKQSCQSVTGAKVEIGSVRANLLYGKLQINDLRIADPRSPMNNLFQAEMALVTLDPAWLWRREFVVDHGVVHNLQFDTSRTASGLLTKTQSRPTSLIQWFPRELDLELAKLHQQFVGNLLVPDFAPQGPQLELLRVSDELNSRWTIAADDQRVFVESVKLRLANLQSKLEAPLGNPLRDAARIPILVEQLRDAESELTQARDGLARLRDQVVTDRTSLLEAKDVDVQTIGQRNSQRYVDSQTLSKILVGPDQRARIDDVLDWIRWLRSATLDSGEGIQPPRKRGVDVQFLPKNRPTFHIRSLDVDGTGSFAGQAFQLVGSIRNLALQPRLLPDPCVIELQVRGDESLLIRSELDRRSQNEVVHVNLECARLPMAPQTLGDDQSLSIDVGPNFLAAQVDIRIHGDSIDGKMTLKQSEAVLRMRPTRSKLACAEMINGLNRELQTLREFSTEIRLSGKLDKIQVELASDLGSKLGPTTARIAQELAEAAAQDDLAKLDELYRSKLADFNQESQRRLNELDSLLDSGVNRVAELGQLVPSTDGLNRIR